MCLAAGLVLGACGDGSEPAADPTTAGLPAGAVASVEGVEDGVITADELERAVAAAALGQGEGSPPSPASPEYSLYAGDALDDLVLSLWVEGEAAERGIVVSDDDVAAEVEATIESSFGGDAAAFGDYAYESHFCSEDEIAAGTDADQCEAILDRFRVNLLTERLEQAGGTAELRESWGPRTECAPGSAGRLCGGGVEQAPPDLPPASG